MPRLASIVSVFAFILLSLLGCGLLEPTSPPPEAIKLARTHGGCMEIMMLNSMSSKT